MTTLAGERPRERHGRPAWREARLAGRLVLQSQFALRVSALALACLPCC
jgi:hypothetical protein